MLTVLGAICDLLEFDHCIEPDKRETFDGLGIIYQLTDVEDPIPPGPPESEPGAEINRFVLPLHNNHAQGLDLLPGSAADDHIQITDRVDHATHRDRPAAEHRVLAGRQLEGAQPVEEQIGRILDLWRIIRRELWSQARSRYPRLVPLEVLM